MKPVVLLLDRDLAFTFWLGRALDKAGYEALPARSIPDARKLIAETNLLPDAVIVDQTLRGGPDFLADLREKHPVLKVIGLVKDASYPIHPEVDWQYCKPEPVDETAKVELFRQIHGVLAAQALSHRTDVSKAKSIGSAKRKAV